MEHHMAVAAPIAAGAYFFTHSWIYAAMAFFTGFLVDVDHVFDYVREEGNFDMGDMFVKSYRGDFKHLYVIFHAWEYVPLSWIIGAAINNYTFSIVFSVSYSAHLLADQLMNNVKPFGYFLTYRIMKGFVMDKFFYFPKGRGADNYAKKHRSPAAGRRPPKRVKRQASSDKRQSGG
jgi:hypothetical protein